jgi:phosphoglycerate kinase
MILKSIHDADLKGKKVLIRFDFNVPLSKTEPIQITDASRIIEALPTIKLALEKGASKIIMMSHLGRPDGKINPKYSLEPVAQYLAKELGMEVFLTETAIDNGLKNFLLLPETKLVLLQNLRFHPEEEKNDREFAEKLGQFSDIYINDAFGAAHRKHASVHMITQFFKGRSFAGLLLKKEIDALTKLLDKPAKPFVAVVGGAKVSDKIKTLEKLLLIVDKILVGGAMAYPFLKAQGQPVGKSLCSQDDVVLATKLLALDKNKKMLFPIDHLTSSQSDGSLPIHETSTIADDQMGLDIGPKTILKYSHEIKSAKTIFWNGPMGLFENKSFATGTMKMAEMIAESNAFSVVGGGDSVAAANQSGFSEKFSHISTGGGASLEFIEKGELPGVQALKFGIL